MRRYCYTPVEELADGPHSAVIGYPRSTAVQRRRRTEELAALGIESVSFTGPTMLGRTAVLGKGYSGVVVLGRSADGRRLAVKIRRTDSQRAHMRDEGALLGAANSAGVGPRVEGVSRNFLIMEYIKGARICDWVCGLGGPGTAARLKTVIRRILTDCYRLDQIGLDHGELNNISKHVIVTGRDRPVLIDFESASTGRRPSNVTSITQAVFISSPIAKGVRRIYRNPPKESIIGGLRRYKGARDGPSFEELLKILKV